jgi:hypothetical protein
MQPRFASSEHALHALPQHTSKSLFSIYHYLDFGVKKLLIIHLLQAGKVVGF